MCIIAAKAAGVPMPNRDTIRMMWDGNRDGAGIMYVEKGRVQIEKGFMKYKSFAKKLDELERRLDLTATPVVMHFRITTHGGTKPENCHPFPITDSIGALQKLRANVDMGVAHNGIIDITPRKGISDTMEYIASQLAPLKRALPKFYTNKDALLLIKNAIGSKMAFLTKEGKLVTIGDFIEDGGILYSNTSYCKPKFTFRDMTAYGWNYFDEWEQYEDTPYYTGDRDLAAPVIEADDIRNLAWLNETDYIKDTSGHLVEAYDYLLDEENNVWQYDWANDLAVICPGATAYTAAGTPVRFDYDEADCVAINTKTKVYLLT